MYSVFERLWFVLFNFLCIKCGITCSESFSYDYKFKSCNAIENQVFISQSVIMSNEYDFVNLGNDDAIKMNDPLL